MRERAGSSPVRCIRITYRKETFSMATLEEIKEEFMKAYEDIQQDGAFYHEVDADSKRSDTILEVLNRLDAIKQMFN